MTPLQTNDYIDNEMIKYFPLGDIKLPPKEALDELNQYGKEN